MKRDEYLKSAFDKFNKGEISAEAYDAILMNADMFVKDEDVEDIIEISIVVSSLLDKYPERETSVSVELLEKCVAFFEEMFEIDKERNICCCGSLEKLTEIVGRDYRNSELLFDIADIFSREYEPDIWHPQNCWEYALKTVVGSDNVHKAFEESVGITEYPQPFKMYRVVLTCFDPGEEPYGDCHEDLFISQNEAHEKAKAMATEECADLNGEDSCVAPEVGCFEVDDCANNDFEVRWYEKKPEERDEGSCDIEYVTTYNVYPVEFTGMPNTCKYRGFDIEQTSGGLKIFHNGTRLGGTVDILNAVLNRVDDICLECAKDKTCALEAVHKVPLEVIIKFASEVQENENAGASEIKQNIGER